MRPPALATVVLACGLVLAGCIAPGTGEATTSPPPDGTTTVLPPGETTTAPPPAGNTTATPPSTPTTTTPAGNASAGTHVFDHAHADHPVIEGGLVYPEDGDPEALYYATLVPSASEATRFDREALPADAREFVDGTEFGSASLVVVQASPKSSIPDYRVESVTRDGGSVSVHLNDSSNYGTDDVTVETVLIRVRDGGDPPRLARITTQTGVAFDTDDGQVAAGGSSDVTLPYRSDNGSRNLDDPRGARIVNNLDTPVRYTLTVSAWESQPCPGADPPCGAPSRQVIVVDRSGTLAPGEEVVFEDLVARSGEYPISVVATTNDGRRLPGSYDWRVAEYYHHAFASITADGIEMTQAVR